MRINNECGQYTWLKYDEIKKQTTAGDYARLREFLGYSDMADLLLRFPDKVEHLHFEEDGSYKTFIITEETEVPEDYKMVASGTYWLKVYDDTSMTLDIQAPKIEVYQKGQRACLIKVSK